MRKAILAAAIVAFGLGGAQAQPYPSRPVTIVVPFAAGGQFDSIARQVGKPMAADLGQPVIIENIGGAGGNIAASKVARAKPSTLVDGCWMGGATPTFTAEPQIFGGVGTSVCNTDHPAFPFPRFVAGAPLTIDVIKCQLREIKVADYTVSFTPAEVTRLRSIFPKGVCDWSKPGVGQTDPISTWITYTGVGKYQDDH